MNTWEWGGGGGTTMYGLYKCRYVCCCEGCIQNMDCAPWTISWTRSMDHHGPPLIFKRKSPLSILYENLPKFRVWQRLLFIEGLSRKSVLFWDHGPMNGKTTNSFWDTEDLAHFYPRYFSNCNSIGKTPIPPSTPRLLDSIVHKNEPIYFINEVYPKRTNW